MSWELHPRNPDLTRTDHTVTGITRLELIERWPGNDTWTVTGPARALDWATPGMGSILTDGDTVLSGRMWRRERWIDEDTRQLMYEVGFVEDTISGRIVYPDRTHTLTATPTTFPVAYDTRTAQPIETLILGFTEANLGTLAQVDRRLSGLVLPPSLGRGGLATVNARLDSLATLTDDLAEAGRLRVKVRHDESTGTPRLALTVDEVLDVSADVRFGLDSAGTGIITSWRDVVTAPTVTHAVLAGGGDLTDRVFLMVADEAAADLWRVRLEQLVDQRHTTDTAELTRAGQRVIEQGATPAEYVVGVVDGPDAQYRRDYRTGFIVGIDGPDGPADNVVREATTVVTVDEDGQPTETVTVVVGTPGASALTTGNEQRTDEALRRIEVLERSK